MILPTIRASLSRSDAQQLVHLLGSGLPGMGYVSLVEAPRDERTSLQTPSQPRTVLCWQDPPVPGPPSTRTRLRCGLPTLLCASDYTRQVARALLGDDGRRSDSVSAANVVSVRMS